MARKNPVPTPAQQEASRRNGRLGGRPRNEWGVNESRRQAALARQLGMDQRLVNLQFWMHVRDSGEAPLEARMRAVGEIEDRYGQPRQTMTISAPLELEPPKMLELVGFQPPGSWNGTPSGNGNDGAPKGEDEAKPGGNGDGAVTAA